MGKVAEHIQEVLRPYPGLSLNPDTLLASGWIMVDDNDRYEVEVDFWPWYNTYFPVVRETGGRIPRDKDRHIYEDSGNCCLTTRFMEVILMKTKVRTLDVFFKEILVPYFQRQSLYEILGDYDHELEHGVPGLIQSYAEVLGTDDLNVLIPLMQDRVASKKPTRNQLCYCGKGKLKKCPNHERGYELFRLVPVEVIKSDLIKFIEWREFNSRLSA